MVSISRVPAESPQSRCTQSCLLLTCTKTNCKFERNDSEESLLALFKFQISRTIPMEENPGEECRAGAVEQGI